MGSEVVMKLPVIDFRKAELKMGGSEEWISVRDQAYKALVEYGCFEALLDGIPKERIYEKLKQVFNLPLESKFENSLSFTGYTKDNPFLPLQERLIFYHVLNPGVIENFSNNLWPNGDSEFCDLVNSYTNIVSEFDVMVRRMIFEKLGVEKYLEEHMKSTSWSLGLFKYRVPKPEEANVGLVPHTDKHLTTTLSQHQVSGLQIQIKQNGQWIDVEFSSPQSVIFLVNDCLKALINGRLHSPYHQVIMGNEERYSMGFSAIAKEGYMINVPEELVDEDHPLLYKPFEALKYLEFSLSNDTTLEKFCGV